MSILNNIVNELDIALRTLADKKTGTDRNYPPEPIEKNSEELSKKGSPIPTGYSSHFQTVGDSGFLFFRGLRFFTISNFRS